MTAPTVVVVFCASGAKNEGSGRVSACGVGLGVVLAFEVLPTLLGLVPLVVVRASVDLGVVVFVTFCAVEVLTVDGLSVTALTVVNLTVEVLAVVDFTLDGFGVVNLTVEYLTVDDLAGGDFVTCVVFLFVTLLGVVTLAAVSTIWNVDRRMFSVV